MILGHEPSALFYLISFAIGALKFQQERWWSYHGRCLFGIEENGGLLPANHKKHVHDGEAMLWKIEKQFIIFCFVQSTRKRNQQRSIKKLLSRVLNLMQALWTVLRQIVYLIIKVQSSKDFNWFQSNCVSNTFSVIFQGSWCQAISFSSVQPVREPTTQAPVDSMIVPSIISDQLNETVQRFANQLCSESHFLPIFFIWLRSLPLFLSLHKERLWLIDRNPGFESSLKNKNSPLLPPPRLLLLSPG